MTELSAVQREIVEGISRMLRVALSPSERERLGKRAGSPEAYHLYLRGRYHAGQGSPDEWDRAVACYRVALETDPGYLTVEGAAPERRFGLCRDEPCRDVEPPVTHPQTSLQYRGDAELRADLREPLRAVPEPE